jgi:hypothetical protein
MSMTLSYKGFLDFFIVNFGVRIVFFNIKIIGIARARNRKIILFNKKINEKNKTRISRFSAFFYSLYKFCGPFFLFFSPLIFLLSLSLSLFYVRFFLLFSRGF